MADLCRDADPGVADEQLDLRAHRPDADLDLAHEGELKGVREQVEDDLLPHLGVNIDRLGQRRAADDQAQASPLDRRAKHAGQLGRQRSKIGWLIDGLDAASLDAREVEQRVHQLQQTLRIALDQHNPLAVLGKRGCIGQRILGWAKHQRQRRAKLVADVAEEDSLCAVELGQCLGALALLLVCLGVREAGRDLRRHQLHKAAVAVIKEPEWV